MFFHTYESLTPAQINKGLKQVIKDGLASEAMSCLTEGAFLIALAIQLGASNFQIGLLAALPTFTNVFQLAAIWLVQRYKSRRAITVISLVLARIPLFIVAALPFFLSGAAALYALTGLMFIHYFFGSIAGASWNSWVKDLVPQNKLGSYFSKRSRLTQTLNVSLCLSLAFGMDYIKTHHESFMPNVIPSLFLAGGIASMISVYALYNAPESTLHHTDKNLWKQFTATLKDRNFKRLLVFNSFWVFAFNLVAPFLSVYMMKTMALPVSYIIFLNVLSQLNSIFFVRVWGRYADKFSNKNILRVCAPLYIVCLFAWIFTTPSSSQLATTVMLMLIHVLTGIATSGINLSIGNIGLKLAPRKDAMMYLAAKNMITGSFSAMAPLIGGLLADFFASHQLKWNIEWHGEYGIKTIQLLHLHQWNFFFITGGILSVLALKLLRLVKEDGEVPVKIVINTMKHNVINTGLNAIQTSSNQIKSLPVNMKKGFDNIIALKKYLTAENKRA
jgi:MFS family permease